MAPGVSNVTLRKKGNRPWCRIMQAMVLIGTGMLTLLPARAAEDPDELYREGRFADAGKIYARSDMDHPKDLRYRYNRGCAEYQAGDYKGAMAAFSSVLRRADDKETRFKAAYNLGNAAFKQGDAASAAAYYRQALQIDPEQQNARVNLEIALRKLAAQKKKEEEKESPSRQEGGQKGPPKKEDQGKSQQQPAPNTSSEKKGDQEKQPDQQSKPEKPEQDETQDDARETGQPAQRAEQKSPRDLSGDLRPREALPEQSEQRKGPDQPVSLMDRKKAEALLDNVREDRSRFLQLQIPEQKRRGVVSGKDW